MIKVLDYNRNSNKVPFGFEEWLEATLCNISKKMTGRGLHLFSDCPFCGKGNKHFSVNLITGLYKCYLCGNGKGKMGGNYQELVGRIEKIDFSSVDEFLKSYISLEKKEVEEVEASERPLYDKVEEFKKISWDIPDIKVVMDYLEKRRVSMKLLINLNCRICLSGKYKKRIIFPLCENGEVVSFVARSYIDLKPRYLYPSYQEGWKGKDECLFNGDTINKEIVLVEGVFDALGIWDFCSPVAILGKYLSDGQLLKLIKKKLYKVTILLDGDTNKECLKESPSYLIGKRLYGFVSDIRIGRLPYELDPANHKEISRLAIERAVKL